MREALARFLRDEIAGIEGRRAGLKQQMAQLEAQEHVLSGAMQACEKMLAVVDHPELGTTPLANSNVVTITANNDPSAQAA